MAAAVEGWPSPGPVLPQAQGSAVSLACSQATRLLWATLSRRGNLKPACLFLKDVISAYFLKLKYFDKV